MWDFTPWSKRNSEPEPRIHEEFTEPARIRLAAILQDVEPKHVEKAFKHLLDYTGQDPGFDLRSSKTTIQSLMDFLKTEEDMNLLLDFLEYLLNVTWSDGKFRRKNDVMKMALKIEKTLVEEGILVQMKPSLEEMNSYDSRYHPKKHEYVRFQQVADETIIEADQELRVLALGDTWEEPLSGYNEAWELYRDGTLTYVIAEKLYNSLSTSQR